MAHYKNIRVKDKPIHYTYWLIHKISETEKMYYYGVRTERKIGVDICSLESYHSSSNVVNAIYAQFPNNFEKRIDKIFSNRKEAAEREIRVHKRLNVAENKKFYNLKNSCENFDGGVINIGKVVALVGEKKVTLKKDVFDLLKSFGIACGIAKNTVTCIDENGKFIRISEKEFGENKNLGGVTKGKILCVNLSTDERKYFTKEEYKNTDSTVWEKYANVYFQYRHKDDTNPHSEPIMRKKSDSDVLSGELIPYCSGFVTVKDEISGKFINVHKSNPLFLNGFYKAASEIRKVKDKCSVYDVNFKVYKGVSLSSIGENFINKQKFLRMRKDGKRVYLPDVDFKKFNADEYIIRNVMIYDKKEDVFIKTNNFDERLLNFKRFSVDNDYIFLYMNEEGVIVKSKREKPELKLIARKSKGKTFRVFWGKNEFLDAGNLNKFIKGLKNEGCRN